MRKPLALQLQMYLMSHPRAANRLLGFLSSRWVENAGRRAAMKAARRAFEQVPSYRAYLEQHGLTAEKMQRLTWNTFQQLPLLSKEDTEGVAEKDLLDRRITAPQGDALIGRSSGTLRGPIHWPLGWSEFYLLRATFEAILRDLGTAAGAPTAIVNMNAVEGGDQSGNMPYRAFYSIKEQRGWNMEIVATGEDSATTHNWLRWFAKQGYTSLLLISFPGSLERLFTYIGSLPETEQINWDTFQHRHILSGGQLVVRPIREMIRREMRLDPTSLTCETCLYVSSDTGQHMARTTRFTIWLERYLAQHPELYEVLGLAEENRDKPLLEFIPPFSMYFEFDRPEGLTLTMWKHRPLIRYKIGDLVWTRRMEVLEAALQEAAPSWRQDFQRAGGHPADVPRSMTLGVVLGRADEICIVNAANVSPTIVQQALERAGIAAHIHHFKHAADPAHPNEYHLYLELPDTQTEQSRLALEEQWREPLLNALLQVPAASDLAAAHRANPITFFLFVRSRNEDEFLGDNDRRKKTYAVRAEPLRQKVGRPTNA
jgi:phenylacetate-coenzyme A ligase PaaK-like adenylate-forming protein